MSKLGTRELRAAMVTLRKEADAGLITLDYKGNGLKIEYTGIDAPKSAAELGSDALSVPVKAQD